MSVYKNRVGLRNVGSYQVSGTPFVTGSSNLDDEKVHMVEFPYVSKSVTVINTNSNSGEDIRVHFQSGSSTAVTVAGDAGAQTTSESGDVLGKFHFITVPSGFASVTFDVKCTKLYISQNTNVANLGYQVFAELTQIPTSSMYSLTGSGITE
tara:strand:+ start:1525 stop:1980 length:456 start_codon:yes stop_codon:yes gene_type:complete